MFTPNRDQARQIFFDTWRKFQNHAPLQGLERLVLDTILQHPEYHKLLDDPCQQYQYSPDTGVANPFLHMWLHVSVREQLSVDQPAGIVTLHRQLCQRFSEQKAEHIMVDALEQILWRTQRYQEPLDGTAYLSFIQTISET